MLRSLFLAAVALAATGPLHAADASVELTTVAERSGFVKTGRYDEVMALCPAFARAYPDAVRCFEFGRTPEGRPMLALVASRSGALTAQATRERGLPVLLAQGGIHAGEIDGKDAGFLALREVLDGEAAKGALDDTVFVFVPVFNVDGHERMGRWNRPNQRGPQEMGWRTTAQNYNLNRDHVKADAPEMQAMLRLHDEWDPIVSADLHVTNGAQFEHDISFNVEPVYSGDAGLRRAGLTLRSALVNRLTRDGSLPLPFYPSFVIHDDPASGFEDGVPPPRFSHGYLALRNRIGVLVETHSWKDYPTRVRATRQTLHALFGLVAEHGRRWKNLADKADTDARKLGGTRVALTYKAGERARTLAFRGYAYTRTPSEISGALMTRYDPDTPQIWKIPLRDDVQPQLTIIAPKAGYLVPPAYAQEVGAKLALHGIQSHAIETPIEAADTQTFRATKAQFSTTPSEGRQRVELTGEWKSESRSVPAGSIFVPIAQPRARLVIAMLEPQAPDSLAAWGMFNRAFVQVEYMEDYVAEDVARTMLRDDPALAAAFHARLASDPEFAKSPSARLEFFARRHSAWDERYNLYPVLRVDVAPPVK